MTVPVSLSLAAAISVGADAGSPVMSDYSPPFKFAGTVKKVLVDVSGELIEDEEEVIKAYLKAAMARQ